MVDRICIGVDGCPGGWICVVQAADGTLHARFEAAFEEVVACNEDAIFAVDMPIGLPDVGHGIEPGVRGCDREARRLLGFPRSTSVFSAPVRDLLAIDSGDIVRDHTEASRISQAVSGRKVTRQTMNILPRIREVDELLQSRPALRDRIFEVHPELSFRQINGASLDAGKRSREGRAIRIGHLAELHGEQTLTQLQSRIKGTPARTEDLLDALACLWSAERIAMGAHMTIPEHPEHDATGLPMSISW